MEKIITSKLLKPGANKRISTVDRNVGVVCCTAGEVIERSGGLHCLRSAQALSQMADISFLEREMKRRRGGRLIKAPYLSQPSLVG